MVPPSFPLSSVALVPSLVVMDLTSRAEFVCTNHRSDKSSLVVRLSRNISDDRLNLSTSFLNATTVQITLQSRGYIGMFHLLCYPNDEESAETRADVIIKADAGRLQLAQRCQVYEKQYIQCIIRATTIARAIRNGFTPDIQFTELTDSQVYMQQHKFLANESTDEYLVFQWRPKIDGQFPDGVVMNIKITLPFFGTTQYRFDMTPTFVIKPDFTIQTTATNKVVLQLKSTSAAAMCEFNARFGFTSEANQTWMAIESEEISIITQDSVFSAADRICVRCRQTLNDLYSEEECREITPISRWKTIVIIVAVLTAIILLIVVPVNIYLFILRRNRAKRPAVKKVIPQKSTSSSNIQQRPLGIDGGYRPVIFDDESSFISESPLSPEPYSPLPDTSKYEPFRTVNAE